MPKAFAVLWCLVGQAEWLVTHDELSEAIGPPLTFKPKPSKGSSSISGASGEREESPYIDTLDHEILLRETADALI
jgi:hypothetical protein